MTLWHVAYFVSMICDVACFNDFRHPLGGCNLAFQQDMKTRQT